mgnify:CR=1 FL=1
MSTISQTYNFSLNDEQQEKLDAFITYKPDFIKKYFSNAKKPLDSQYIYNVKAYFKRIKKNKYLVNDKYSFSDCGRMFSSSVEPDGRSIQGLSNELRSYLLILTFRIKKTNSKNYLITQKTENYISEMDLIN